MYYIITGASGFIGRWQISEFARFGDTGIAVSRSKMADLPPNWVHIQRQALLADTRRPRQDATMIHLEVKQHVTRPSKADIDEFRRVNVQGTQEWLDWCTNHGIRRFIYFSSIKALDSEIREYEDRSRGESRYAYGASKWLAEQEVIAWARSGVDRSAVIVRPCVVYGPGNRGNVGAMVKAISRNLFFLVGEGKNMKSMVSVRNVVAATRYLAVHMALNGCSSYTLVDPESFTLRELDAKIRGLFGKKGQSTTLPLWLATIAAWIGDSFHLLPWDIFPFDSARLKSLVATSHFSCDDLVRSGFEPRQTTDAGLAEMIEWYSNQG